MRRILVTGGAGFIGSNFIRYMLGNSPDDYIVNLDALTYAGNLDNLKDLPNASHYSFFEENVCNASAVHGIMRSQCIDTIVNFAAESHVDRSIAGSTRFIKTNVVGTEVLLAAALKYGVDKFVQIGTDEVYGSLDEGSPSSIETDPLMPRSPYAASKASADLLALSYFHTHGMPVCVTRSSNNYGAYQYPEKIIPLFITNILRGKQVPVYGEGRNIRDWLHVEDNCRAIKAVLDSGRPGEVYNIAGGNEIRNIELTERVLTLLGKQDWHLFVEYVKDRKGHDWRYSMNCDKMKDELGWQPQVLFEDGLRGTVKWYERNEEWWTKLI
uniref:Putative GDP-mannose 4,6-dehydratase n=1 Tax=viral metagenome TaxID=1070528 RepID=A0A6M3KSP1_9ZZZZ